MFKKSDKNTPGNIFSGILSILNGNSLKQYNDNDGCHNQFHKQIDLRIDTSVFKVLYSEKTGVLYAPVCVCQFS